jgi:hypothetical protein
MIDRSALAPMLDHSGRFAILALDHRDSLRAEFDAANPEGVALDDRGADRRQRPQRLAERGRVDGCAALGHVAQQALVLGAGRAEVALSIRISVLAACRLYSTRRPVIHMIYNSKK